MGQSPASGKFRKEHVRVDEAMLARMQALFEQGQPPRLICESIGISQATFSVYKRLGFQSKKAFGSELISAEATAVSAPDLGAPESHVVPQVSSDGRIHNLGPKEKILISGHPTSFFGLRRNCGVGKAGGGNYWGNVSKVGAGAQGIIALKRAALEQIALRTGDFPGLRGFTYGASWTGGGADYVGYVSFGSAIGAFRYLGTYFLLCACPDAVGPLKAHGIDFIPSCEVQNPSEISLV